MTIEELELELDKAGIAYDRTSDVVGDREYIGINITGKWSDLPEDVRERFLSQYTADWKVFDHLHQTGEKNADRA